MTVKGVALDANTRCRHYSTERDIIAIKFKCCETFYACFECHVELADHSPEAWGPSERDMPAVLCGFCRHVLTIQEYMESGNCCTTCGSGFNPGCKTHYHLYFSS